MHYYQFNIGDYKSHTEHLSEIEDLCYRRLLDWYYLHEVPIPLDLNETARQIRMRTHTDCIAIVLHEYFEQSENGWIHHRANAGRQDAGLDSLLCRGRIRLCSGRQTRLARVRLSLMLEWRKRSATLWLKGLP